MKDTVRATSGWPGTDCGSIWSSVTLGKAAARLGFAKESRDLWKSLDKDAAGAAREDGLLRMGCAEIFQDMLRCLHFFVGIG